MCSEHLVGCTNSWTRVTCHSYTVSEWRTIFNTWPCSEPSQWQNRLSGSLWFWASFLFMCIIACSTSSLGHEMFELLDQSADVVPASWVQLEKGKSKERRKKSNNLWHNHYPGTFCQMDYFWIANSAICGHSLLNFFKLMNKWSRIKQTIKDVWVARFGS